MNKYHVAKLVQWGGTLRSRKKMQKVVYLLQSAGCPLDAGYLLHHYGPYSQEVARLSDEMVKSELLAEESEENQVGRQYSYRITSRAEKQLQDLEASPKGRQMSEQLAPFEKQAKELLRTDLLELEVASTIVYFRRNGNDWGESVERTRRFKNLAHHVAVLGKAERLARQIIA